MNFIPIQNVSVFSYKNKLFLVSDSGILNIDVTHFLPYIIIVLDKDRIELKNIKNNLRYDTLNKRLSNIITAKLDTLSNVIKRKLFLFGIGFRSWTYKSDSLKNYIILKVGFSRDISIEIPKSILITCLKPTLILLKSIDKSKLFQFVSFIRSIRKPDIYKGKGVQYIHEKIVLKLGKNN
jgi:large subunit ribosomal protein L6|uniref:ribosomal protein L6 n=1 Tax=Cryptomonas pyrenoidifera TaxID=233184 RepID=UPI00226D18BA|nr:ribosomal protein L6 [Cryptomonas pyrenoidifera]UZP15139.1 ribosomal protein L6 [Cryptomonas pyrenoidifera]